MFKRCLFLLSIFTSGMIYSQVGIGTTTPTATLDINGDLKIGRLVEELNLDIAKDSILIISRDGKVNRISSKAIVNTVMKSAVKGHFSGTGVINLSLGSGTTFTPLPFDTEDFDLNEEFDLATGIFTAKQEGIYEISVQINSESNISSSANYGVSIFKNGVLEAIEDFANLNINVLSLNLNITPPIRKTKTLLQLNEGDTIEFQLFSSLNAVNLSRDKQDSFFTIVQIR